MASPWGEGFFCRAIFKKLGFSHQLSQSAKSDSRAQPLPRGSEERSWTQGWRSQTEGEKQEANGGQLAFIRAVQAFTCHGAQNVSAAFQFYSTDFHVTTQPSLILSWAPRKNRFLIPLLTPSRTARPRTCRACAPWSGRSARPRRPRWSAHSGWDQNPSPWP